MRAVDTLIPHFWRINRPSPELAPSDGELIGALSRPAGLLAGLAPRLDPYRGGNDPNPAGDVIRAKYALAIIRARKPRFMTVQLSALDAEEHAHAPFSAEANQELEMLDGFIEAMAQATRASDPGAAVVVVSDPGLLQLTARIDRYPALVEAGLLSIETAPAPAAHRRLAGHAVGRGRHGRCHAQRHRRDLRPGGAALPRRFSRRCVSHRHQAGLLPGRLIRRRTPW